MLEFLLIATILLSVALIFTVIVLLILFNKKCILIAELQEFKKNILEKNALLEERIINYHSEEIKYKNSIIIAEEKASAIEKSSILLKNEIEYLNKAHIISNESLAREHQNKVSVLENEKNNILETFNSYKQELERYKEKMSEELKIQFASIANNLLKENSKSFGETSQKDLAGILLPLQEKIKTFQGQVERVYLDNSKEQFSLKNEIKNLMEETCKAKLSAENLANALKGNNKMLGNWGEIMLINVLQHSGLQENRDYVVQTAVENNSIPDVIVYLPGNKHIIIDAKTTFGKYEEYCSANNEKMRTELLQSFIGLIKKHIVALAKKEYQYNHRIDTPNFVLMFIPIEAAYILALNSSSDIYNFALENNVFIVSPTSLMVTLRTVAHVWSKEYQSKNAIEIAEKAGSMYDKFVAMVAKIEEIGKSIKKADDNYEDVVKYLSKGNANLCKKAEELKNMGAKARKTLPISFIDGENKKSEIDAENVLKLDDNLSS